MTANKNTDVKPKKETRKFTFTLTTPGMVSLLSLLALVVSFFFVLGILIGRGYRPEAEVPQLARIMPEPAIQGPHAVDSEPVPEETLKAEELDFDEQLSRKPDEILRAEEKPAEAKPADAANAAAKTATAAKSAAKPASPATPAVAKTAQSAAPALQTPPPPKAGEQVFDYVFQVASFRKRDMAQSLADKLVRSGLPSYVDAGTVGQDTWYRVYAKFTGTPSQVQTFKNALADQGVHKPIIKTKTPAK